MWPSPLPLVSPCDVCTAVALGALWRHRRLKRGFSEVRPLGPRPFENRGALKRSRPHPGRPSGGLRGAGGAAPPGDFLQSRGASTKMRAPPRVSLGDPRTHQGSPPARPFLKPRPRESPSDPHAAHRCPGGTGERAEETTKKPHQKQTTKKMREQEQSKSK